MTKRYRSRYQTGPGPCRICGRKLDGGDSYSIRPGQEKPVCIECDRDQLIDGQIEERKIVEMEV